MFNGKNSLFLGPFSIAMSMLNYQRVIGKSIVDLVSCQVQTFGHLADSRKTVNGQRYFISGTDTLMAVEREEREKSGSHLQ